MNKIGLIASSLLVAAAVAASASASAAYSFLVTVEGSKQGPFKGESLAKGEEGKIPASAFSFSLRTPRDPGTGQATGKRQYSAVSFTKAWGASSPQFFQAGSFNEVLKSVKFEFTQLDAKGAKQVYQTMTLTNAFIGGITRRASSAGELEEVSVTFQKIELVDNNGLTSFADTFTAN